MFYSQYCLLYRSTCLSGCPSHQHACFTNCRLSSARASQTHPITHSILPLTCMKLALDPLWAVVVCAACADTLPIHLSATSCPHPLLLSVVSLHSVFEHDRLLRAARYQVTADRWQAADGFQLFPHLGHRGVHLAPTLRSSGQAGQDQRLDSSHQWPLRVAAGEMTDL